MKFVLRLVTASWRADARRWGSASATRSRSAPRARRASCTGLRRARRAGWYPPRASGSSRLRSSPSPASALSTERTARRLRSNRPRRQSNPTLPFQSHPPMNHPPSLHPPSASRVRAFRRPGVKPGRPRRIRRPDRARKLSVCPPNSLESSPCPRTPLPSQPAASLSDSRVELWRPAWARWENHRAGHERCRRRYLEGASPGSLTRWRSAAPS
mmetsp:Transcript_5464/g.24557  ORF Transcript_5464/g.24557 Transcript_5464/m.24557 type:complete len:213 (+) Transcript_5464:993-1631(+)